MALPLRRLRAACRCRLAFALAKAVSDDVGLLDRDAWVHGECDWRVSGKE